METSLMRTGHLEDYLFGDRCVPWIATLTRETQRSRFMALLTRPKFHHVDLGHAAIPTRTTTTIAREEDLADCFSIGASLPDASLEIALGLSRFGRRLGQTLHPRSLT